MIRFPREMKQSMTCIVVGGLFEALKSPVHSTPFVSQARGLVTSQAAGEKSARLHPVEAEMPCLARGISGFFFFFKKKKEEENSSWSSSTFLTRQKRPVFSVGCRQPFLLLKLQEWKLYSLIEFLVLLLSFWKPRPQERRPGLFLLVSTTCSFRVFFITILNEQQRENRQK